MLGACSLSSRRYPESRIVSDQTEEGRLNRPCIFSSQHHRIIALRRPESLFLAHIQKYRHGDPYLSWNTESRIILKIKDVRVGLLEFPPKISQDLILFRAVVGIDEDEIRLHASSKREISSDDSAEQRILLNEDAFSVGFQVPLFSEKITQQVFSEFRDLLPLASDKGVGFIRDSPLRILFDGKQRSTFSIILEFVEIDLFQWIDCRDDCRGDPDGKYRSYHQDYRKAESVFSKYHSCGIRPEYCGEQYHDSQQKCRRRPDGTPFADRKKPLFSIMV